MDFQYKPCKGEEPYIFVSYRSTDREQVIPVVDAMCRLGYRLWWYDKGIDLGADWRDFVAERIMQCEAFIAFHSAASKVSEHCKAEISWLRQHQKPGVSVYLEDVELPSGLRMYLHRFQSIRLADGYASNSLVERLCESGIFSSCGRGNQIATDEKKDRTQWHREGPLEWRINDFGVLSIQQKSTSGRFPDYGWDEDSGIGFAPWMKERENIHAVEIRDGITRIGSFAFAGCPVLTTAVISGSTAAIHEGSFAGCARLSSVSLLPGPSTRIYNDAFFECTALYSMTIPDSSVVKIDRWAFSQCSNLACISVPASADMEDTAIDSHIMVIRRKTL